MAWPLSIAMTSRRAERAFSSASMADGVATGVLDQALCCMS